MDNTEVVVPSASSHWSLRLVDIQKPFPSRILANATYKVIRFFYPPFALEAVNITHEVSSPELNVLRLGLLLGCFLLASGAAYTGYKYFLKEKQGKLEPRLKSAPGSEHKLVNWERKDTAEPLLTESSLEQPRKSTNVIPEAPWQPDSIDDLIDGDSTAIFKDEAKMDLAGDKQDDLTEQINKAVWEGYISKIQESPLDRA